MHVGISFITFAYTALNVSGNGAVSATFKVTNTGRRGGSDVPQVHVTPPGRAKGLIGWERVALAPEESHSITVRADPRLLADYDAGSGDWKIRPGLYRVGGAASAAAPVIAQVVHLNGALLPGQMRGTEN